MKKKYQPDLFPPKNSNTIDIILLVCFYLCIAAAGILPLYHLFLAK